MVYVQARQSSTAQRKEVQNDHQDTKARSIYKDPASVVCKRNQVQGWKVGQPRLCQSIPSIGSEIA